MPTYHEKVKKYCEEHFITEIETDEDGRDYYVHCDDGGENERIVYFDELGFNKSESNILLNMRSITLRELEWLEQFMRQQGKAALADSYKREQEELL